jgi:hypothetical protein
MARISVFLVFATVTEVASMAVIEPLYRVFFALTVAGAGVAAGVGAAVAVEFVEVWAWVVTGAPAKARPRMAARAGVRREIFIGKWNRMANST